ncbi:MAG TPA: asparagine synthase (glutamine-hydrolyzing), partial [Candidatus Binatia bacterium]|nr:asparagine synthase (glutamine-hydrolyzing) [Candidatus Binatia bacterium]
DRLRHRGPDDEGEFVDGRIGLGHRRLSIIDLATGHQPLGNEDGRIQIVFNGEIYNFRELQRDAERNGHRFATRSDTEAIVHGYEDLRARVVERLNGMFAFAIWDANRQELFLARDRTGIKPLYYAQRDGWFAFASEISPLLQLPWVSREIEPRSLDTYLARGYVPAPRTMFREIHKLPAAHTLTVSAAGLRIARYWSPDLRPSSTDHPAQLAEVLASELDRSVRMHLVSDVPLGAFLSGGLDSSIVVALMRRHCTGTLKTFSVGVDGGRALDESEYARAVSQHLGTEHHAFSLRAEQMPELVTTTARFLDEPISDPASVPTYLLAKLARESVTVVLTGEGADETWGGYDVFRKAQLVANYRKLPRWLRRGVTDPMLQRLPGSDAGVRLVAASRAPGYVAQLLHFEAAARRALYTTEGNAAIAVSEAEPVNDSSMLDAENPFGCVARDLLESHLAERLLQKVDRMTMAHSLEARVPFLDYELVEFAFTVPARWKVRGQVRKYLLRRAFGDLLPPAILRRPKHAFDLPCAAWLRSTLAPLAGDLFAEPVLSNFIDRERVSDLWQRHRDGAANHDAQIWALMTLELWARTVGAH